MSRPLPAAFAGPDWDDLPAAVATSLRRDVPGPLLARRAATVTLVPHTGSPALLELRPGRPPRVRRGRIARPTASIRGPAGVLLGVATGQASGVLAFLDGELQVRGDLNLAMSVESLLDPALPRPATWPAMRRADPLKVPTALLVAGRPDAPPVVLLHGLGASNASLLPLVVDLARDHYVIAPDLPGFGGSAAPRCRYDAAWYARWLAALTDELGLDPVGLIGNSMGGRIALEAALTAPERVRALVLLAPSPAFLRLRQWVPVARLLRPELAAVPVLMPHRMVVEGIRSMFSDPERLPVAWYDAAADEFRRVMRSGAHRVAFFACLRQIYLEQAFGERGFWTRLPSLQPPALFIWGDRDRLVPSSYARHVSAALPNAAGIVLEDCGHVPQFEHPEPTATLVRGFLDGAPQSAATDRPSPGGPP